MTRPAGTVPFYLHLPSGAGVATIHLPEGATAADVKALGSFVYRDEKRRLGVRSDYEIPPMAERHYSDGKPKAERIADGQAALKRAIEVAMPLANKLSAEFVGHNALVAAVLAAYYLRTYEMAVVSHGVNPPRNGSLAFIGGIADQLNLVGISASANN